jgi:protein-tyrosine sulfotransferase
VVLATGYPEFVHRIHDFTVAVRSLAPFARCPLQRNELYRPFFIIGAGRSGNTLLRRVLTAHPAFHIPPETYVLPRIVKRFRRVSHMEWADIIHFIYAFFQFHEEFETFDVRNLSDLVHRVASVDKKKRSLAFIINAFYEWHAQQHGLSFERWGDKTPLNVFGLKRIHQVFPEAQFIHIVRDGCDVVASHLEAGICDHAEEAAWGWRTAVGLCQSFGRAHPHACLEVRYEDFVTGPRETTAAICAFLGVAFDECMLECPADAGSLGDVPRRDRHREVLKPISTASIGKGRRALSEDQKRKISTIIGKKMADLGYADCMVGTGASDDRHGPAGGSWRKRWQT